ncbi:nuclear pore complex protein Nup98-Nup96-like, partial [Mantella aurantiaca]
YGSIYYDGKIDVSNLDLDEIVHIRNKEVIVYTDDAHKPPVGEGLNRAAEVTLNEVWPINKTTRELIKCPDHLTEINYKSKLEAASRKQGAQFKEYRPETGSWVFRVKHFSKYGLQDSDEEDDSASTAENKKIKSATLPPPGQQLLPPPGQQLLSPPGQQLLSPPAQSALSERVSPAPQSPVVLDPSGPVLDSDMLDVTQYKESLDITEEEEEEGGGVSASIHIASSLGVNPHSLQVSH